MRTHTRISFFSLTLLAAMTATVQAGTLASWDFNSYDGDGHEILATNGSGKVVISDAWNDTALSNPKGSGLNAASGQPAGTAIGFSGEKGNGQSFDIELPVKAGSPMTISAAMRRSGTGFKTVTVSASSDGGKSFSPVATWTVGEKWSAQEASLPPKSGASTLVVRLTVDGATGARGSIRFDNLKLLHGAASTISSPVVIPTDQAGVATAR